MSALTFPPDIQQFLHQEIASGAYRSEEDLVIDAVRLLRDGNRRFQQFRDEVRARVARLERGEGIELDSDEALETFFDELEAEVASEPLEQDQASS